MKTYKKEEAFLLRSVDYGDHHRILSFLTKSQGRVDCIALGAQKSQKRFPPGVLDFLNHLSLQYQSHPRGGLHHLKQVDMVHTFPGLRAHYDRLQSSLAWCALLARVLKQEGPVSGLFSLFQKGLSFLEKEDPVVVDLVFRRHLLSVLGYQLQLKHCVRCEQGAPKRGVAHFSQGGLLCDACHGDQSKERFYSFLSEIHGQWPGEKEGVFWQDWEKKEVRALMERAFEELLGVSCFIGF